MNFVLAVLLVVACSPTASPAPDESQALAILRKLNAQIKIDEKAPGRPVIAVNL